MRLRAETRRGEGPLILLAALLFSCTAPPPPPPDAGVTYRYPQLPHGGGPVLRDVELVSVTVGGEAGLDHHAFVQWLAGSGWLTERAGEYGVERVRAGATLDLAAPGNELHDADVRELLRASGAAPGRLYVVWLAPGLTLFDRYANRTCFSNPGTGYHEHLDAPDVAYVVVPACPPRFSALLDQAGSMHLDGARLVVDALTNPSPRNAPAFALTDPSAGWSSLGPEAGDFCWGRFVERDGVTLQRVWSNQAIARDEEPCQPAGAGPAFGFRVEPAGRRTLSVGERLELEVNGWSTGEVPDWPVQIIYWSGDFTMEASLEPPTLNDGVGAKLTLSVPFEVPSGTAGSILLRALGETERPQWPVAFITR